MEDNERIVTFSHIIDFFGLVCEGDTDEQALEKARRFYQEGIDNYTANLAEDGRTDFWQGRIEEATAKRDSLQVETFAQYKARMRKAYITPPTEITEEHWWKQYEVLPPAGVIACERFIEFYISEAYEFGYHSGYLHDRKTGKYWSGVVDSWDLSTRLCIRLGFATIEDGGVAVA